MPQEANDAQDQPWGFWVFIRDRESANWAMKMSGLVVFLLGVGMLFPAALFSVCTPVLRFCLPMFSVVFFSLSAFFMFAGLQIRKGSQRWLLVSTPFVLLSLVMSVLYAPPIAAAINCLHGVLFFSGLRGWWWLRKHQMQ